MPGMGQTFAGIIAAAATIAALIVIGRAGKWLWDVFRKLARLADDLTGEPPRPGFPDGRPGVLDRLATIEDRLDLVPALEGRLAGMEARLEAMEAQLKPDGGQTLRDAIDRLSPQPDQLAA